MYMKRMKKGERKLTDAGCSLLQVEDKIFFRLQRNAVERLRDSSKTAAMAANFMKRRGVSSQCLRLPWLFEALKNIGMDFWDDSFLERALELSLLMDLRDIKYRGRIPVSQGVTLLGVLDETKFLEEGEVFVNTEDGDGNPEPIEGRVLVTRSPVHHPGDVQMVNAVSVPATSPLRQLRNAVVFSQLGDRPLPSMLAGGDLDGGWNRFPSSIHFLCLSLLCLSFLFFSFLSPNS